MRRQKERLQLTTTRLRKKSNSFHILQGSLTKGIHRFTHTKVNYKYVVYLHTRQTRKDILKYVISTAPLLLSCSLGKVPVMPITTSEECLQYLTIIFTFSDLLTASQQLHKANFNTNKMTFPNFLITFQKCFVEVIHCFLISIKQK